MQDISSLFDVSGKVALITGATGGFGAAVAKGLARAGVKIMASGRSEDTLTPLVSDITDAGGTAAMAAGRPDVHNDVIRIVEETRKVYGSIDILITAAGVNKPGPITEQPLDGGTTCVTADHCSSRREMCAKPRKFKRLNSVARSIHPIPLLFESQLTASVIGSAQTRIPGEGG